MADFGVLKKFRHLLMNNKTIQEEGVEVFLGEVKTDHPHIIIELEEIWSAMRLSKGTPHTRIKLKGSAFLASQHHCAHISSAMIKAWDGQLLDLEEENVGIVRLTGSVIDFPGQKTRMVRHFYEILVRH